MRMHALFARILLAASVALLSCVPALPALASDEYRAVAARAQQAVEDLIEEYTINEPTYADDFSADDEVWNSQYDGDTSRYFRAGEFHISVDVENTIAWSVGDFSASDFYAEVETLHTSGGTNNQIGIIFRMVDADNFYFFSISSDGSYALERRIAGEWEWLIEFTESNLIESGEDSVNIIGVLAEGSTIGLVINGFIADEYEDDSFDSGNLALAVVSVDEPVDVAFDNFSLWTQPTEEAEPPAVATRPTPAQPPTPETTTTPEPAETPESTETPEPGPTETEMPLPTATVDEPTEEPTGEPGGNVLNQIKSGVPSVVDDFAEDNGAWQPWELAGETLFTEYWEGALYIRMDAEQTLGVLTSEPVYADFYAEIGVAHATGPDYAEAGLVFRYQDAGNYYLYVMRPDGQVGLWKRAEYEWIEIVGWTASAAFDTSIFALNRIGVLAEGTSLTLFVNEEIAIEAEDDLLAEGSVGLVVGTFSESSAEFMFDDYAVWPIGDPVESEPTPVSTPSATPIATSEVTPEATETVTATEPVTPTIIITATPVLDTPEPSSDDARVAEIRSRPADVEDDFAEDLGDWLATEDDDVTMSYVDGSLHLRVAAEQRLGIVVGPDTFADAMVEVDFTHADGSDSAQAGLFFRYIDTENNYLFAVTPSGYYAFWKRVAGEWETLIAWTESDAILTGTGSTDAAVTNRIGVIGQGPLLSLLINGQIVAELTDDTFSEGVAALSLGTFSDPGVVTEFAFDNYALWLLEPEPVATAAAPSTTEEPPVEETPVVEEMVPIADQLPEIWASEPAISDDFRLEQGTWSMNSSADAVYSMPERAFAITVLTENWIAWSLHDEEATDFLIEVEAAHNSGPRDSAYGIVFRLVDSENFYLLQVGLDGFFRLERMMEGEWTTLVDWTESEAVDLSDDALNRIGVFAKGAQIGVIINDEVVAELTDDGVMGGRFGLAAIAFDDPGVEFLFDNFDLWRLEP